MADMNSKMLKKEQERMRKVTKEIAVLILAVCSVVALFADVESTGNLSMALNGDGIPQLIALVLLIYAYRRVWVKKDLFLIAERREHIGYALIALLFSIFMIIGKAQNANEDLKYSFFAVLLFIGYMPLFYMVISLLGTWLTTKTKYATLEVGDNLFGKITKWIFEKHVIGGVMLVVFLCRLPYLIAFYPCSMSWDGGAQICNFYGIETFSNHHPPLISYLYGSVAFFSQKWGIPNLGMFVVPVLQTMLSAFAVAKVCEVFKNFKIPYAVRWASLAYYGLFTVWCIFDVTYIKDSIYWSLTLLYTVQLVYCILDCDRFWSKKYNILLWLLYGILMTQTRNNGIFVLLFTIPAVLVIIEKKRKSLFLCASVAMFVLIYMINNMIYPALGVIKLAEKEDTYCIMFQQTAKYGQDYPEDVTNEEREFLNEMFDYEELVQVYNPQLADWVKNCLKVCEASSADGTNAEFSDIKRNYFRVWADQLKRHPLSYIDTFFACSYGYYYPEVKPYKEGTGFYEMDRHMLTEGMHGMRQIERLAPVRFLLEQLSKLEYVPGVGLLYRCGFYTWCVIFAVGYLMIKKRYRELVIALPALVNILVCLISPVNTCIRYVLPTMCMVPLLYGLLFMKGSDQNEQQ